MLWWWFYRRGGLQSALVGTSLKLQKVKCKEDNNIDYHLNFKENIRLDGVIICYRTQALLLEVKLHSGLKDDIPVVWYL